jgi:sulfoxide reductase heme-binding subunit YedZ
MLWGPGSEPGSFLLLASGAGTGLDHAVWLGARSTGLVAYALATCSVLLGLVTATWTRDRNPGRGTVYDTHRALSLLTVLVVAGHVLLLAFDRYARFSPTDLLVPFASWYRPAWTGLGVLAAYALLVVFASFYVRSRIGYKTWRTLHYATFAVFVMATAHGLRAGSDSGALWARWLYTAAIFAVAWAVAYRLLQVANTRPARAGAPRAGDLGRVRAAGVGLPARVVANSVSNLEPPGIQRALSGGNEDGGGGEGRQLLGNGGTDQVPYESQGFIDTFDRPVDF